MSQKSVTIAVPLLGKLSDAPPRTYVLAEEVRDRLDAKDTGRIDGVLIVGLDKPIFVRGGLIFEGVGTQNRAVEWGEIVLPNSPVEITVKCVHASYQISPRATMRLSEASVPSTVHNFLTLSALGHADQRHVWKAVARYSTSTLASSRIRSSDASTAPGEGSQPFHSDNLLRVQRTVGEFNKRLKEVLEKLPVDYPDQVGMALIDTDGLLGLELFDHPDSWRAVSRAVARKYAEEVFSSEVELGGKVFNLETEALSTILVEVLRNYSKRTEKVVSQNQRSKTYVFEGPGFVGERTELDGHDIHLMMARGLPPTLGPKTLLAR